MDHDERDRPDDPDPQEPSPPAGEPSPGEAAPEAAGPRDRRPEESSSVSASEIESWPSGDFAQTSETGGTEPPPSDAASVEAWPTEPPAAGSAEPGTWRTTAPEIGEDARPSPPEPEASAAGSAAPPGEVEAYSAPGAPPADEPPMADETPVADEAAAAVGAASGPAAGGMAAQEDSAPSMPEATGESTACPRCGTENPPGLSFCRNCGQRLVAAGVATTVERPAAPEGTMACPRCGTHNRAGVAFCQNCGANLRGTAAGYVPPAVAGEPIAAGAAERGGAVLGPVVLLIGIVGLVTAYLLPFAFGSDSLFERAFGSGGYGIGFWSSYPDSGLADQAYFGLAAASPLLAVLLGILAIAGFVRARPGMLQGLGLGLALLWSVGLAVLFVVVEMAGNWDGDLVGMLRVLTPAGIIFFLGSLIVIIGTLTRFGRS